MKIRVKSTIEKYGSTPIARAMGLTPSTVHGWAVRNKLPSWRVEGFNAAIAALRAKTEEKEAA